MMLAQARQLCPARDLMLAGGWGEFRGVDVWHKCLGIVGLGAIGRAVARRGAGFSMRLLAHDPGLSTEHIQAAGARPVALAQLLEEADYVTLHAALTPDTAGMIGEAELRSMKRSAFLINAARGRLVDEAALLRALKEGWIAGAALDVYTEEPLPSAHPLRQAPNCLALPHNAFNTEQTAVAINEAIVTNVLAVMRGERPPNLVNVDLAN
jgi:phosphoglycerate dehydrogenase-like enzyme